MPEVKGWNHVTTGLLLTTARMRLLERLSHPEKTPSYPV